MAQSEAAYSDQPLRPGDLGREIVVANSASWQPGDLLYMRLQKTLEPGKLELRDFYWDTVAWNRNLAHRTGLAWGSVRLSSDETLWVNPRNGYVYLGNELVGAVYRVANFDMIAVYFVKPIAFDNRNDIITIKTVANETN